VVTGGVDGVGGVSVGTVGESCVVVGEGVVGVVVGGFDLVLSKGAGVEHGFVDEAVEVGPGRVISIGECGVLGIGDIAQGAIDTVVEDAVDIEREISASSDVGDVVPGVVGGFACAVDAGDLAGSGLGVESWACGGDAHEVAFVAVFGFVAKKNRDVAVGVLVAFLPDHEGEVACAEVQAGVFSEVDVVVGAVEVEGFAEFPSDDVSWSETVVKSSEVMVRRVVGDAGGVRAVHRPVAFEVAVPVYEAYDSSGILYGGVHRSPVVIENGVVLWS